jgi:hypothetical protein
MINAMLRLVRSDSVFFASSVAGVFTCARNALDRVLSGTSPSSVARTSGTRLARVMDNDESARSWMLVSEYSDGFGGGSSPLSLDGGNLNLARRHCEFGTRMRRSSNGRARVAGAMQHDCEPLTAQRGTRSSTAMPGGDW